MTAQTSMMAYQQLLATNALSPARQAIVKTLEEMDCRPMTRAEISKYSDMSGKYYPINSVCGRVKELVDMGVLLEDGTTKKCSVTGQTAKLVRLAK